MQKRKMEDRLELSTTTTKMMKPVKFLTVTDSKGKNRYLMIRPVTHKGAKASNYSVSHWKAI